jgi:hypothetical protein
LTGYSLPSWIYSGCEKGVFILTLNGNIITNVSESDAMYDHEDSDLVIIREGIEKRELVPTTRNIRETMPEKLGMVLYCEGQMHTVPVLYCFELIIGKLTIASPISFHPFASHP